MNRQFLSDSMELNWKYIECLLFQSTFSPLSDEARDKVAPLVLLAVCAFTQG